MRRKNAAEVKVSAPSRGLITRVPSDQPPKSGIKGAFEIATNVRFEDGVLRNAPGFTEIQQCTVTNQSVILDSDVNLIFQEQVLQGSNVVRSNPIIGTAGKLYIIKQESNENPTVNAGIDATVIGLVYSLSATVVDSDSKPVALTYKWLKVSGPSTATFVDSTLVATNVTVGAVGVYVFRMVAFDGAHRTYDDVQITFQ